MDRINEVRLISHIERIAKALERIATALERRT